MTEKPPALALVLSITLIVTVCVSVTWNTFYTRNNPDKVEAPTGSFETDVSETLNTILKRLQHIELDIVGLESDIDKTIGRVVAIEPQRVQLYSGPTLTYRQRVTEHWDALWRGLSYQIRSHISDNWKPPAYPLPKKLVPKKRDDTARYMVVMGRGGCY